MSWTSITSADLKDRKVAALVDALQSAALGDGQGDPTAAIIASVVSTIRANVKSCASNTLDADASKIPSDLKDLACRMILRGLKNRLEIPMTEDERTERGDDNRTLERIAKCELRVEVSDSPEPAPSIQSGGGITVASKRTRVATGSTLKGL